MASPKDRRNEQIGSSWANLGAFIQSYRYAETQALYANQNIANLSINAALSQIFSGGRAVDSTLKSLIASANAKLKAYVEKNKKK